MLSLGTVVRETGLRPDTLRVWEERYGIPSPGRGAGGQRAYTLGDLERLKWLAARQRDGMRIGEAMRLLATTGAAAPLSVPINAAPARGAGELDRLRSEWLDACLALDEARAEAAAAEAFALHPVEVACRELFQRGLADFGAGWASGRVTVQQEHFASNLVVRRVNALIAAVPAPTRPGRLWVGCAPGEAHALGTLFFTLLLRRRGWSVVYLGADVPADRLDRMAGREAPRPDVVVLAANQLAAAAGLVDAAGALAATRVVGAYGGRVFVGHPELRARIPAHYLGDTLEAGLEHVEQMARERPPAPAVPPLPPEAADTLTLFCRRRAALEAQVWDELDEHEPDASVLVVALGRLGRDADAALALGDPGLLRLAEDPLLGLGVPGRPAARTRILSAYAAAAARVLDDRGADLVRALSKLADGFSSSPPPPEQPPAAR